MLNLEARQSYEIRRCHHFAFPGALQQYQPQLIDPARSLDLSSLPNNIMNAPFLVPVEAAEEVATDAGAKLYDLAILGSEATARFLKNSGSSAGHLAYEEEAWAAAKSMKERHPFRRSA